MPIDYSKYPPNWKSEIRPAILERDGNRCKFCLVENSKDILRGEYRGGQVYQYFDSCVVHSAYNGHRFGGMYLGDLDNCSQKSIRVVLTIAHLDHDITNNEYANLAALCQKCHNRHDKDFRNKNRASTRDKKKGLNLFEQ